MKVKELTVYEIAKRLIGQIAPVGETNEDQARYENLEQTIELVDRLLYDIHAVAANSSRPEASMKKAGERAREYLVEVRDAF